MSEPRPIPRKVIGGAVLLVGAAVALVVLRAKDEPLHVPPDASAVSGRDPTPEATVIAPTTAPTPVVEPPASAGFALGPALSEAKSLDEARAALARKDPKAALAALDAWERGTHGDGKLQHEATLLRVETLPKLGRKSDALVIAFRARDDDSWSEDEKERLRAVLGDAGL